MSKSYQIAVVGATGAVGMEMINVISQRNFPVDTLTLLASERSAGKRLEYKGKHIRVQKLVPESFNGIDIALFSAGASVSKEFAPIAARTGTVVVDNSSAWRMDADVPLVVPEVNPQDIFKHKGIIANPNCSTIQMVVALKPLHDAFKIKRVVVSSYQSVSGTGKKAMDELAEQTTKMFSFKQDQIIPKVYPHRIAFNCLPQIDVFLDNGYTKEEMKMVNETRKILGDDSINVCPTTVRVPVFVGHAEAINIETEKPITPEDARRILAAAPGVKIVDDPAKSLYPMQINCAGTDDVFVGRIRQDFSIPNGLNMWIVADNLRKGAALNAVQIAERWIAGK